ncbi:MAG: hypothetical protein J6A03_04850 [Lachnospiraceae bacterium]|nr:hypothetical protein [Lachnospiraceae bacterium]
MSEKKEKNTEHLISTQIQMFAMLKENTKVRKESDLTEFARSVFRNGEKI